MHCSAAARSGRRPTARRRPFSIALRAWLDSLEPYPFTRSTSSAWVSPSCLRRSRMRMAQVRLRWATVWYAAIVTSADRADAPVFQVFAYSRILAIGDSGKGAALVPGPVAIPA